MSEPIDLPSGPYSTIVVDPPWRYNSTTGSQHTKSGRGRTAERHYATMTVEELLKLPVEAISAPNAHIYLWTTNPRLFRGRNESIGPYDLIEGWGFRYITTLTWIKGGAPGLGWYFRGQTEHVLFGVKGNLIIPSNRRVKNVFTAPRSKHSAKPDFFYEMVESVSPGPYVDLFSRTTRPGWDGWGLEYPGGVL